MFLSAHRPTHRDHAAPLAALGLLRSGYGRFLQVDPVGYQDAENLYAYVKNDPVNKTDPSGEQDEDVVVTGHRLPLIVPAPFPMPLPPSVRPPSLPTIPITRPTIENGRQNVCAWTGFLCNKPPADAKDPNGAKAPGKPGAETGFTDPPNGEDWGKVEEGPMSGKSGWVDSDGKIWVPSGQGAAAHGGAHWDVQDRKGRDHENVYPGGRRR